MSEYQNDFNGIPSTSWLDQEIKMPLDVYKSMCEQSVRTTCERDAYSQKWSQALVEVEKLRNENAGLRDEVRELTAIIDRLTAKTEGGE